MKLPALTILALLPCLLLAQGPAQDPALNPALNTVDLRTVHRIKHEAFKNSQVMDHLFYLVDVHGPRLTGSPGFQGAADFAVERMKKWGLENVRQEKWGPFGQGWSYQRFSAHLIQPRYEALIGVPMAWSPGTKGVVKGTPILAPLKPHRILKRREAAIDAYIKKYRGTLGGKIVMIRPLKDVNPSDRTLYHRYSGEELIRRAEAPAPPPPIRFDDPELEIPEDPEKRRNFFAQAPAWFQRHYRDERRRVQNKLNKFLADEGPLLVIHPASRGDGGTVFPPRAGTRFVEDPVPPPSIAMTPEHYNRIFRLAEKQLPVVVEVETQTRFHRRTLDSINVIGELPGDGDGNGNEDEIVMIGAHLDSVAPGLGATDNAAGCAVMMEVMRILKTLDLRLDRTVRIALWGGEEQGLRGSKAYVKEHFADPETMKLTGEHGKLAAYFNLDNGTGKIRGVYLQGNDMVRPVFKVWLEPFADLGATTLSIRNTGGTDHLPFNEVGLPAFQFIQDSVEYETRTHHSNMDIYDRIQPSDLMQASAIIASFVYQAANRAEKLPRKPLPKPPPKRPE